VKATSATGKSMDPGGTAWNYLADADFPRDITILQSDASTVFANGERATIATGVYNHHLIFTNMDKKAPVLISCGGIAPSNNIGMSIIMGGAEDKGAQMFSTLDGKFNSGYYVGKNDRIMMSGDVVNYKNETQTVFAKGEIEYIEGKVKEALETNYQLIDVGICDGKSVMLEPPKGQTKFTYKGQEITMAKDAYFVTGKGHLHDGGVNLIMKLNGKEICNSNAEYGGVESTLKDGDKEWNTINHMTYCEGPVKVVKGDKLLLEANYDLESHPPRMQHTGGMAEEMALIGASFAVLP